MPDQIASLDLEISPLPGASYSQQNFPLRITFVNKGGTPVFILNQFEPLPVFFSFHLANSEGTPIQIPGAGKIDLGPSAANHIKLDLGETWHLTVDIAPLFVEPLRAGAYSLSVTYHNQYGGGCFHGRVTSNVSGVSLE